MDIDNDQSPFGNFALDDEVKSDLGNLSIWDDILVYRVGPNVAAEDAKYFSETRKQVPFATLNIPGKQKYADFVGGVSKFEMLAKEGNSWKWDEAFASVEAWRIGAIPGLTFAERQTGAADCIDSRGRPLDVKILPAEYGFSAKRTLVKRVQGKGGYTGEKQTFPAVIIFDTSFASPERRMRKLDNFAKLLADKTQVWRVIEVHVAYGSVNGFCDEYNPRAGSRPKG